MCVCACLLLSFLGGSLQTLFVCACDYCENSLLSFRLVCAHGAVFAYRVCYTTNLEGVALLHPPSHASVIAPFYRNFLIVALGLREHANGNISQLALFTAET